MVSNWRYCKINKDKIIGQEKNMSVIVLPTGTKEAQEELLFPTKLIYEINNPKKVQLGFGFNYSFLIRRKWNNSYITGGIDGEELLLVLTGKQKYTEISNNNYKKKADKEKIEKSKTLAIRIPPECWYDDSDNDEVLIPIMNQRAMPVYDEYFFWADRSKLKISNNNNVKFICKELEPIELYEYSVDENGEGKTLSEITITGKELLAAFYE